MSVKLRTLSDDDRRHALEHRLTTADPFDVQSVVYVVYCVSLTELEGPVGPAVDVVAFAETEKLREGVPERPVPIPVPVAVVVALLVCGMPRDGPVPVKRVDDKLPVIGALWVSICDDQYTQRMGAMFSMTYESRQFLSRRVSAERNPWSFHF